VLTGQWPSLSSLLRRSLTSQGCVCVCLASQELLGQNWKNDKEREKCYFCYKRVVGTGEQSSGNCRRGKKKKYSQHTERETFRGFSSFSSSFPAPRRAAADMINFFLIFQNIFPICCHFSCHIKSPLLSSSFNASREARGIKTFQQHQVRRSIILSRSSSSCA